MSAELNPASVVVRAGRGPERPGAGVNAPITLASTYRSGGELSYGREGNDAWAALEEVLGALEGGTALVFASGMAAIAAVLESLAVGATVVAPADAYTGTRILLADLAGRGRLFHRLVDTTDVASTLEACEGAEMLWLESPSNPLMAISDLAQLATRARERNPAVTVVADNTFATPLLQRPLALGVDVVVHSVTKYLAGHSDVIMGVAVTSQERWAEALAGRRSMHGGIPGPLEAYLALRGLRTLDVRMARAQANAAELARRLADHPLVEIVRYPGLAEHPGHGLAARQMSGPGAMLSFDVAGGAVAADRLCAAVRLATSATSLGGVETLIERRGRWRGEEALPPGLCRLSVGIEDVEDLWADLDQALGLAGDPTPDQCCP